MKIKNALFGLIILSGLNAFALPDNHVRDELIATTDRSCGIHYLTHNNTIGWYLTEVEGTCVNGVLNGFGHVSLRNAFGKVVQDITGFFVQGYPTQSNYEGVSLKTLWLADNNLSLTFDLGKEERLDIKYLGRMTSLRQSDETYTSFDACHPAIILAVTPNLDLFEDEAVQQELINSVINRIAPVCPDTTQIYFYGSDKEDPENKDIAFFADINMETGHIKVRRLPSSPRIRDVWNSPKEAADIPVPHEIRRESGLPVVQITPVKPGSKPTVVNPASKEPKTRSIPISTHPVPKKVSASESVLEPQTVPTTQSPSIIQPNPAPATEAPQRPDWDDIPALLTAARLLKQPVEGKALIHISQFDNTGIALTDNPTALRVKGDKLPLGWIVVQGLFSYTPAQTSSDTIGFVQVQSFKTLGEK